MLNFVVSTLTLHLRESERNKTKKIIEMKENKQESYKSKNKDKIKHYNYGYCEYCGQYLPWFCVCYLNKK